MRLLDTENKNKVLMNMMQILNDRRQEILDANAADLKAFDKEDRALYDRLVLDNKKVDAMIRSVEEVLRQDDPVGQTIEERTLDNELRIINKTAPFGTIMIIYESRPDVTIEAAVLAFKANNRILLKGGKEAKNSNRALVNCWHQALQEQDLDRDWIQFLELSREETQEFLRKPDQQLDLIVPRGGERLIRFVKDHAQCAVLVSGRGNNFAYVAEDAELEKSLAVIENAKTDKISACNALDKILIDKRHPRFREMVEEIAAVLAKRGVSLQADDTCANLLQVAKPIENEHVWYQEFLAMRAVIAAVDDEREAIGMINKFSGGHSVTFLGENPSVAQAFMEEIDAAAVYHNASTRFTDGGAMGVGAELAISTDKLHHRGPLGLKQLVTNKYYVFGDGQIRV